MSKQQSCETCKYFHINAGLQPQHSDEVVQGTCRRYPPTPIVMQPQKQIVAAQGAGMIGSAGINPPVTSAHSCGEWAQLVEPASVS